MNVQTLENGCDFLGIFAQSCYRSVKANTRFSADRDGPLRKTRLIRPLSAAKSGKPLNRKGPTRTAIRMSPDHKSIGGSNGPKYI